MNSYSVSIKDPVLIRLHDTFEVFLAEHKSEMLKSVPEYQGGLEAALTRTLRNVFAQFLDLDIPPDHPHPQILNSAEARAAEGIAIESILKAWNIGETHMWDWLVDTSLELRSPHSVIPLWTRYQKLTKTHTSAITEIFSSYQARDSLVDNAILYRLLGGSNHLETAETLRRLGVTENNVCIVVCKDISSPSSSEPEKGEYNRFIRAISVFGRQLPVALASGCVVAAVDPDSRIMTQIEHMALNAGPLRLGVSVSTSSLTSLKPLWEQASSALTYSSRSEPLTRYSKLTVLETVMSKVDIDPNYLPRRIKKFFIADSQAEGIYLETAEAMVRANLRTAQAAEILHVHVNTIYHRRRVVLEKCEIDIGSVRDLQELLMAKILMERA